MGLSVDIVKQLREFGIVEQALMRLHTSSRYAG